MSAIDFEKDYYRVLGLEIGCSLKEIKDAHVALAKEYHPDLSDSPIAEERFREIQEAYTILKCDRDRNVYDASWFAKSNRAGVSSHGHGARRGRDTRNSGFGARGSRIRYHTPNPYTFQKKVDEYVGAGSFQHIPTSSFDTNQGALRHGVGGAAPGPSAPNRQVFDQRTIAKAGKAKTRINLAFCIIPFVAAVGFYSASRQPKRKRY
jgi:DnaJ-class molecular chaperone